MRQAAWITQALAVWLLGFFVFGLGDSASPAEVASHGMVALLLLLASWHVLTERVTVAPSAIQLFAGVLLCLMPRMFAYPARSFAAVNDVLVGTIAAAAGLIEIWPSVSRGRAIARVP
jgi:hypothetical protein